jgi:FkbM family methyltransferase
MAETPDLNGTRQALNVVNQSLGFLKLALGRDGLFLANVNDVYIGRSLLTYGEYNGHEAGVLRQLVHEGDVVIEAGANIGSHTVGIARKAGPRGRVIAYEPQRLVFQHLCANISLNSLQNVECQRAAVGSSAGTIRVPELPYDMENNFGGLELDSHAGSMETSVVTIDETFKYNRLNLIKVDVEGWEADVIEGARQVIARFKPTLFVENDRLEKSEALIRLIRSMEYRLWWIASPLFSPENFAGEPGNIFGQAGSVNMLGIHRSINVLIEAIEITHDSDRPPWEKK